MHQLCNNCKLMQEIEYKSAIVPHVTRAFDTRVALILR